MAGVAIWTRICHGLWAAHNNLEEQSSVMLEDDSW